jgi:hypothetical protein
MRMLLVTVPFLLLLALPATAQEGQGKTKSPPAPLESRTFVESLDMSSGLAVTEEFIAAYAASDYLAVYYLLSPNAKMDFVKTVNQLNIARLFPRLDSTAPAGSVYDTAPMEQDMVSDVTPDGAMMFDDLMMAAERQGVLPFDLRTAGVPSATIDQADQGRYMVATQADPGYVLISTIRLSNGDWRVERVVWAASDPAARPWGKKL